MLPDCSPSRLSGDVDTIEQIVRQREGKDAIDRRVGREANPKLVEKHSTVEVSDTESRWSSKEGGIEAESRLDRISVVRTRVPKDQLEAAEARRASPVEPAKSSPQAEAKAASKRKPQGPPAQSVATLLEHLKALTLNQVTLEARSRSPRVGSGCHLQATL